MALRDPLPWEDLVQVVQTAEETGYRAVFLPETNGREAFATLAGLAGHTSSMELGTGVVTVWARSPATTAMAAATVHDRSGGRAILGIGAGKAPDGAPAGPGPLERVRRYVAVVRRLLGRERAEADPALSSSPFELSLGVPGPPPPVWLGALGDRMVALAGEVADGVILNWCTPDRVTRARALVEDSAVSAGRDPEAFTLAVYLRTCLGVEDDVAVAALRPMTALYASFAPYRRQLEQLGLGEAAEAAARAHRARRPEEVPEDLVRTLAVTGGRDRALARLQEYRDAGADLVVVYPVAARDPFSSILASVLAAAPSSAVER